MTAAKCHGRFPVNIPQPITRRREIGLSRSSDLRIIDHGQPSRNPGGQLSSNAMVYAFTAAVPFANFTRFSILPAGLAATQDTQTLT